MNVNKLLAAGLIIAALSPSAWSQEPSVPKCAIMPVIFLEKNDTCDNATAKGTVMAAINADLEKAGIEAMSPANAKAVYTAETGKAIYDSLPTPAEMLIIGRKLKAKYVMAAKLKWDVTSKWVALGPKTKAYATVDMLVIDTDKQEIVINSQGVKADSTKIEKSWETAASLLVTMGATVFSGGPKTPHMERSGVVAVLKAMEPWLSTLNAPSKKIVLDDARGAKLKSK